MLVALIALTIILENRGYVFSTHTGRRAPTGAGCRWTGRDVYWPVREGREPLWLGERRRYRAEQRDHLHHGGHAPEVWPWGCRRGWLGDQAYGGGASDARLRPRGRRSGHNPSHPRADRGRGRRGRGLGQGPRRADGQLATGGRGLRGRGRVRRVRRRWRRD